MKVKELQKTVNIAWSPLPQHPIYLAAGTAAQQFDSNVNSQLEIYSTNFSDPSYDLELKASLPSQYRFQKIIWSPTGYGSTHRNGLIVGGCEGGHVMIYSPSKMLANEDGLIARQDKHTGPVSGLDFNPFQTNLLASCASESEIFIWDLNNTTTHMNPGTKTQPFEDVKNVAWNRQVQHILASVFSSRCVIWDLRKSEQIIKLSDTQSRVRWHAIQWHPDVATQVWLASEDDQAPVVQLWDLRYATAPAKTMQIHQRGMLGMSWCPRDNDLMVSCGKDNRIYCWNPNTQVPEGEILSEVATTATWYADVQWCPRNPALIASSSLDGNVSIYSLFGGTQQQVQTANKIADSFPGMDQFAEAPMPQQTAPIVYHDLKYAPKWIKKPCGVTFGFGGKLVSFNNKSKTINISQVTTEPVLVERAKSLEKSLSEANFLEYCRQKADEMTNQNDRYLWYFIKANFERNPKEEILNLLGFNKDDIDSKFSKYLPEEEANEQTTQDVDQLNNRMAQLTHQQFDNNTVFDGIAAAQKDLNNEEIKKPLAEFKIPSGEHADSLITEAILTGNLEAAVQLCLNSKRTAEAFIIASTAGIEFLTKIQNNYLLEQQSELSNVISALVTRDWMDFVSRCTIDSWKEALIAALKHSERKVVDICEKLGDRLLTESSSTNVECTRNAMLCYICAGNIDKLVSAWYQLKQLENHNTSYKLNTEELQELAEIVMLMNKSLEEQGIAVELNTKVADFIKEYGGLLVAQGAFTAALTYIMEIKASATHPDLDDLKQRIFSIVQPTQTIKQQSQFAAHSQNVNPAAQSMYQRQQPPQPQQQPRGSFSQIPTHNNNNNSMGGYPGTAAASSSMPAPITNSYMPPVNSWNANPVNNPMASPFGAQPLPAANPAAAPPLIFNPNTAAMPTPTPFKPPVNDNLSQPPRPLSTASSQGGTTSGGGLPSRSKYVLDPSVAPAGPMGGYGNTYNPAPAPAPQPASFNNTPFNANPMQAQMGAPSIMQPTFNPNQFSNNAFMPGVPPIETATAAVPQTHIHNMQRNPTPPPGWNDPPALKTQRQPKKIEPVSAAAAAITHPLFGVDPNQNQNGYMDPNAHYQQGGMPPPPNTQPGQQQTNILNPSQPPMMGGGGGGGVGSYYNPAQQMQNNNFSNQQMNFQTSAIPGQQQQGQQQQQQTPSWQTQPTQGMMGNIYPDQTTQQQPQLSQRQPEPPKEKPPLPEEYIYLQTVLEELKTSCLNATNDARTKRKFVDVNKRMEHLYDCLRDGRLNPATIDALNQMIQYIQIGDYGNSLQVHTQIAFSSDFSQCAGFMPGLKVLIQSANELQVYLR